MLVTSEVTSDTVKFKKTFLPDQDDLHTSCFLQVLGIPIVQNQMTHTLNVILVFFKGVFWFW